MSSQRPSISSEQLRDWILEAMEEMKALEVACLPVGEKSTVADYFVICTGTSETHCRAIAGEIARTVKEKGPLPMNAGEQGSAAWTLLDFGGVVVHVFSREARSRYDLDGVWAGAVAEPGVAGGEGESAGD